MGKRPGATVFLIVLLGGVVLLGGAPPARGAARLSPLLPEPDQFALIELLKSGNFQGLEQTLTSYQDAFEESTAPELWVDRAFLTFINSDPGLEDLFKRWKSAYPKSFALHGAQGVYYWNLGWHARGGAYFSKTHPDRLKRLRRYHNKARFHLTKAVGLRPRFSLGYARLIDLANVTGARKQEDWAYREGLAATPGSVAIRRRYLAAQLPWWGGSYERVNQMAAEARTAAEQWPALAYLGAYDAYAQALKAQRGDDPRGALPHIDAAIETASNRLYLWTKAEILSDMDHDDLARPYFDQALDHPYQPSGLLDDRALLLERQGDLGGALRDWEVALRIDPYEPNILRHRANVLWRLKRHDEAKALFDRAIVHGDLEARVQRSRGSFYLNALKDYRVAADSFEAVTRLEPGKSRSWYDYASALYFLQDCKIMPALRRYLKLCLTAGDCKSKQVLWAIQFMAFTWWEDECALDGESGE